MPLPAVGVFVVATLSSYVINKGLDALLLVIEEQSGFVPPTNGHINDQLLNAYKAGIPNTYNKYGVLFEFYWIPDAAGDYILIPRGYGQTPAHAIVNEIYEMDAAPDLAQEIAASVAERKQLIGNEALKRGHPLEAQGVWLEFDPSSRKWSVDTVSIAKAEAAASVQIKAQVTLKELAANSVGLDKIRLTAIAWNKFYEQYEDELRAKKIHDEVRDLIQANEDTTRKISEAIERMRNADASAGFYRFLGLISAAIDVGNACIGSSDPSIENAEIRAEYERSSVIQMGEDVYQTQVRIRHYVVPNVNPAVIPEGYSKGWVEPILRPDRP